jgi:hypothetical protein
MRRAIARCFLALGAVAPVSVRADHEVEGLAIATGVLVVAAVAEPAQKEPTLISFELGRLDPVKNVQQATTFGAEYRFGEPFWWKLRPFFGGGFTSEHGLYGYGGIRLATFWGERIVATPSFAIGGYSRGSGKDLGSPPVVGRFGIDLEYRFDSDVRVGAAYHHISNGKALNQANNPGTEIIGLTLSIPLPQ